MRRPKTIPSRLRFAVPWLWALVGLIGCSSSVVVDDVPSSVRYVAWMRLDPDGGLREASVLFDRETSDGLAFSFDDPSDVVLIGFDAEGLDFPSDPGRLQQESLERAEACAAQLPAPTWTAPVEDSRNVPALPALTAPWVSTACESPEPSGLSCVPCAGSLCAAAEVTQGQVTLEVSTDLAGLHDGVLVGERLFAVAPWLTSLVLLDGFEPTRVIEVAPHRLNELNEQVAFDGRDAVYLATTDGQLLRYGVDGELVWTESVSTRPVRVYADRDTNVYVQEVGGEVFRLNPSDRTLTSMGLDGVVEAFAIRSASDFAYVNDRGDVFRYRNDVAERIGSVTRMAARTARIEMLSDGVAFTFAPGELEIRRDDGRRFVHLRTGEIRSLAAFRDGVLAGGADWQLFWVGDGEECQLETSTIRPINALSVSADGNRIVAMTSGPGPWLVDARWPD